MGNLGWPEILMILVIALIIFGPRKLPELGKTLGQSLAQFRKASEDFKRTWEEEVEIEKRKIEAPPASAYEEASLAQQEVSETSPPSDGAEPAASTAEQLESADDNYWNEDFNLHGNETTAEAEAPSPAVPTITHDSQAVPRQAKRDWM
jgi:TatA/E family protein of Tat protein translocase